MKRTATTSLILIGITAMLIGLNLLFYTDTRGDQEDERSGSRSTYSPRPFGTRGFYLLLRDLGYQVMQFEHPATNLNSDPRIKGLFINSPPFPYSNEELAALEAWVHGGGTLVIIDREIEWAIAGGAITMSSYSKYKQWRLPHVVQPTRLTAGVERVQLTEFGQGVQAHGAPVTDHVGDQGGSVLIDFRYGQGRIILLGEPYVVANNGISVSDNLTLALNIVRIIPAGVIAFDEYHHGYGMRVTSRGGIAGMFLNLYDYYKQTPVIGLVAQLGLIVAAWLYSRGRRFTRPIPPLAEKRRRSLEYVAAMAGLAQRHQLRPLVVEHMQRLQNRVLPSAGGSPGSPPSHRIGSRGLKQSEMNRLDLGGDQFPNDRLLSDHELLEGARRLRELEARKRKVN